MKYLRTRSSHITWCHNKTQMIIITTCCSSFLIQQKPIAGAHQIDQRWGCWTWFCDLINCYTGTKIDVRTWFVSVSVQESKKWYSPTETDDVNIPVSDSRLVWKVGKGGWPFFEEKCQLQEEREKGRCLRFSDFLSPLQASCRPSSKKTLFCSFTQFPFTSSRLSATSLPLYSFIWPTPPHSSHCQPLVNQIDSTVREDSLPLYVCNLSAWHSTSPNLPCRNLSEDPYTYLNHIYAFRPCGYHIYHKPLALALILWRD